jgi:hypothetical protein
MTTVRVPAICGFLFGIQTSPMATYNHIGNDLMGRAHTWYHFLREVGLDIGVLSALAVILFAAPRLQARHVVDRAGAHARLLSPLLDWRAVHGRAVSSRRVRKSG